ncbi:MAG: Gldg family protein, partial [Akkermansiaceae bacterium]
TSPTSAEPTTAPDTAQGTASAKVTRPVLRAMLGIFAVILIVIFSNWLVRSTSVGNQKIDLTEDDRYTLTDGTKAILSEVKQPVIIRYYATRQSKLMPHDVKNYMRQVDDMLENYKQLANGNIRIEHIDPQPDTDAEDSANLDGIAGQRINNENLYFGLCISCLDQQATIPYLNPASETMLEYHLSSAIANVTTFKKPTIGVISGLPIFGAPAQQPGQRPQQPWVVYRLLHQRYQVQTLPMNPKKLDPEETPVLLLVHPAGITDKTEYLIDQYVLQGGIVIACLDSFALTAPAGDPRMRGMGGTPKFSTFSKLLPAWGIGMDTTSVVADGKYTTDFGNGQRMFAHLSLTPDAIPNSDEIVTRNFENIYLPLAGGFTLNGGGGISVETLLRSSKEVVLIPGQQATRPDPGLFARESSTGKHYGLVLRLSGKFKTAFPDGDPEKATADAKDKTPAQPSLKQGVEDSTVYLISDADFLFDRACFHQTQQGYIPINNNAALLQNILDQCTGSKHLIGARSRSAATRPFTRIKDMQTDYDQEIREEVLEAQKKLEKIREEYDQLQAQKTGGKTAILSDEQMSKLQELRAEQIELTRDLREKQKGLQARKDNLYNKITWMAVAITPSVVILFGVCVWLTRRFQTRAK